MDESSYDVFISYRHLPLDKALAIELQTLLETYRPPTKASCTHTNRIKKVFRDESELPTSPDLDAEIKDALKKSRFLVVICSKNTIESKWCKAEIDYFQNLHHGDCGNILIVLADGEPQNVIFPALRLKTERVSLDNGEIGTIEREIEPLYADVRSSSLHGSKKKLKTEFLRIAAPVLGCSYDDLYQRHHKRRMQTIVGVSLASVALMAAISLVIGSFESRSRNATALLYYKEGINSIEREKNNSLGMMYFADSLALRPGDGASQSSGLALLLQSESWPFIAREGKGRIIGDTLVMPESERHPGELEHDAFYIKDSFDLQKILALDAESGFFLTGYPGRYSVIDSSGAIADTLEGDFTLLDMTDFGASKGCWVFTNSRNIYIYRIQAKTLLSFERPWEVNPKCDMENSITDFTGEPISVAAYDDGLRTAVAYAGYLHFYEASDGGFTRVETLDLALEFENTFNQGQYLYCQNQIFIDENEKVLAVINLRSICFIALQKQEALFTVNQTAYIIGDVAFSPDNSKVAIGYGSDPAILVDRQGGYAEVRSMENKILYSTDGIFSEPISLLRFNSEADKLMTYSYNKTARIWDLNSGTPAEICNPIHSEFIEQHAVFCKDYLLAAADHTGNVQIYAAVTPADTTIARLKHSGSPIVSVIPTGADELAVMTLQNLVFLDSRTGEVTKTIGVDDPGFEEHLSEYSFEYQNDSRFDRTEEWLLQVLIEQLSRDVFSKEDIYIRPGSFVEQMLVSIDGRRLYAVSSNTPCFAAYDIDYDKQALTLRELTLYSDAVPNGMWQSSDGSYIIVSTQTNEMLLYTADELNKPFTRIMLNNQGQVEEFAIDPSGTFMSVSLARKDITDSMAQNGLLEIWSIATKTNLLEITDGRSYINGLRFVDDTLYYGVDNELHRLWLPQDKISAERIRFFQALSSYKLDDSLTPVTKNASGDSILSEIQDEWSKLYRIIYNFK